MACVLTWPAFLENSLRNVWSVKTLDTWTTRSNDVSWKEKLKDIRSLSPFFRVQASLSNRRFMSQARLTRQFARSAKRVRSARWGEELRAKCRVRLSCLIKRLQEPIKLRELALWVSIWWNQSIIVDYIYILYSLVSDDLISSIGHAVKNWKRK